jgi:DNA-directed RNA polymerase beta' subunit
MSFKQRALGAYLSLLCGFWVITLGMIANGSASPRNPFYGFVTTFDWLLTLPPVLIGALYVLMHTAIPIVDKIIEAKNYKQTAFKQSEQANSNCVEDQERIYSEENKRLEKARLSQIKQIEDEKKLIEENLRRTLEKQNRSPEDAAKAALGDF